MMLWWMVALHHLKRIFLRTRPEVLGDSDNMPRGCAATGVELPDELPLHR
jgi:hypothetical protein